MSFCHHTPNGLGVHDENGRMVCARCGASYDDKPAATPASGHTHLGVDIEMKDGAWWPYLADAPVKSGSIDRVGNLPNGTAGGKPALQILVTLDDGTKVIAQTTWASFSLAMVALIARWGTP